MDLPWGPQQQLQILYSLKDWKLDVELKGKVWWKFNFSWKKNGWRQDQIYIICKTRNKRTVTFLIIYTILEKKMYALTLCYSFIQHIYVEHLLYSTYSTKFQRYNFYEIFDVIVSDETDSKQNEIIKHITKQYVQEQ